MSDSERVCVRVLRQIRPGWRRPDIILWRLGPNTWVGYSVGDVADKLVVRMWGDQDQVRSVLCSHCFRWCTKHHLVCRRCVRTAKPSCTRTKGWVPASWAPSATGT